MGEIELHESLGAGGRGPGCLGGRSGTAAVMVIGYGMWGSSPPLNPCPPLCQGGPESWTLTAVNAAWQKPPSQRLSFSLRREAAPPVIHPHWPCRERKATRPPISEKRQVTSQEAALFLVGQRPLGTSSGKDMRDYGAH